MKKLMVLALLLVVFLVPFFAYAEGEEETTTEEVDQRVIVYFFHGDGCPHCAEAEEWFESIEGEYGSKFRIAAYEVWNDAENAALMQSVSDLRGDDASGVPYILIGDKSWIGFSEATMGSEMKAQIDALYEVAPAERYDAIKEAGGTVPAATKKEEEKSSVGKDILSLIIVLLVAGGIGYGIYRARKTTD